ncbi:hypothetical protein KAU04_00080, partial [bacterium]|nr:hypothetical protein [bacterium]
MTRMARVCPIPGIFFCLFLIPGIVPQAGALDMLGFDLSNQMEYSWDTEDETLENWLDVNYRMDILTTGLRYEVFQPSKTGQRKEEVSFIYFQVEKDDITLRVGDYYANFGRGLTLRAHEDRDLRV